jgi:hypothetical protein
MRSTIAWETNVIHASLGNKHVVTAQVAPTSIRTEVPVLSLSQHADEHDNELDEPDDDELGDESRLELALGPDGYADALLRQVEQEAEEEMRAQHNAGEEDVDLPRAVGDEDGYAGDSEESGGEGIYVN